MMNADIRWTRMNTDPNLASRESIIRDEVYPLHMKSVISSKGQLTVPSAVRKKLGLTPGTVVDFELAHGKAILRKAVRAVHPVDQIYGILKLNRRTDELLDEMRGPRPKSPKT
jgi:antitoxin PrlF